MPQLVHRMAGPSNDYSNLNLPHCQLRGRLLGRVRYECAHPYPPGYGGSAHVLHCQSCNRRKEAAPCRHLGARIETIRCQSCINNGVSQLDVYACAVHGRCVERGATRDVSAICLVCPDWQKSEIVNVDDPPHQDGTA